LRLQIPRYPIPFDSMNRRSDDEVAAKLSKPDASDEVDRLSTLNDDVLLLILCLLFSTYEAAQTNVLSRRWLLLWTQLPALYFNFPVELQLIASALVAHQGSLEVLVVSAMDAAPQSVQSWLPLTAPRLYGSLVFINRRMLHIELNISSVRFHRPRELGDIVSSQQCPVLNKDPGVRYAERKTPPCFIFLRESRRRCRVILLHPRAPR
jgi:hypothetical protein